MKDLGHFEDSLCYSQKAYLAAKKFKSSETPYLLERMIHSLIATTKYKQTSNRRELLLTYSVLNRKNDEESLRLLEVLVSMLEKFYQYEEALDIGQSVLHAKMEKFSNDLSKLSRSHRFVNEILSKLGGHEEAIANRKKLEEALRQQHCEDDDEYFDERQDLAKTLYDLNRWEEALEFWQALLKIDVTEFPEDWRIIVDQVCIFRTVREFDGAREMWVSAQATGEGPFSKLSWPASLALWEISGMLLDSWKCETALSIQRGGYVDEDTC
jgi:tetratricopeptide (TPR) repeat protein